MKKALVLAGGGTRGSYQNGALKALKKIHETDFDIVTGTWVLQSQLNKLHVRSGIIVLFL